MDHKQAPMAVFFDLRLLSLAVLMLASQLNSASAALKLRNLKGTKISGDFGNKPDPFVEMWCGGQYKKANTIKSTSEPDWSKQVFEFTKCNSGSKLEMEVWDEDVNNHDKLGWYSGKVSKGSHDVSFSVRKGTIKFSYTVT